jgi:hypothetical protein
MANIAHSIVDQIGSVSIPFLFKKLWYGEILSVGFFKNGNPNPI